MSQHYYISAGQAVSMLQQRSYLRSAVEEQWQKDGLQLPDTLLQGQPTAVMAKQLANFNFESALFVKTAEASGLQSAWFSYADDTFVTQSSMKRALLRPSLVSRLNKRGEPIIINKRLVENPDRWHGRKLSEIKLTDGKLLTDWHLGRLYEACPNAIVCDLSHFARLLGGTAKGYYKHYLSMFVAHAVLFDDFHSDHLENTHEDFTKRVFEPAVTKIFEEFGVVPLIVPLPWWRELDYFPDGEWLSNWQRCDSILLKQAA